MYNQQFLEFTVLFVRAALWTRDKNTLENACDQTWGAGQMPDLLQQNSKGRYWKTYIHQNWGGVTQV